MARGIVKKTPSQNKEKDGHVSCVIVPQDFTHDNSCSLFTKFICSKCSNENSYEYSAT